MQLTLPALNQPAEKLYVYILHAYPWVVDDVPCDVSCLAALPHE